jgi:hypothetical protein
MTRKEIIHQIVRRERVIAEIQRWHEQGRPLTRVWKEYPTLTAASFAYFGTWRKAVAAAGLADQGGRK